MQLLGRFTGVILFVLTIGYVSPILAQTGQPAPGQIKVSSNYIWAEVTERELEDSRSQALEQLKEQIFRRYSSSLQTASGQDDDRIRLERTRMQIPHDFIVESTRRSHTVLAYARVIDVEDFVKNYVTLPFRNRDDYTYGEATGTNREAAESTARTNLINQYVVMVTSDTESMQQMVTDGTNYEFSEEFRSQARAISQMQLIGAQTQVLRIGEEYYAMVYLSKENEQATFNLVKNQALSFLNEGQRQEQFGNISQAYNNYYRAYLMSTNYFSSFYHEFADGTTTGNLRDYLRLKVENFLYNIPIDITQAYQLGERNIEVPFTINIGNHRMNGLRYEYEVQGEPYIENVRQGRAKLEFVNYSPTNRMDVYPITLKLDLSDQRGSDDMLALLEDIHEISVERNIEVDFSNVLRPTIRGYPEGGQVSFFIHSRLLNVRSAQWDFGDGEISFDLRPEHRYAYADEFKVTVIVNNDPELSDTKYVNLNTGIIHNRRSMIAEAPVVSRMSVELSGEPLPEPIVEVEMEEQYTESADSLQYSELPTWSGDEEIAEAEFDTIQDTTGYGRMEFREEEPEPEVIVEQREPEVVVDTVRVVEVVEQIVEVAPEPEPEPIAVNDDEEKQNIYASLLGYNTTSGFIRRADFMVRQGLITYGRQTDIENSDGALVIIADRQRVHDYLVFRNNRYYKIDTGEEVVDLAEHYQGKSMIWVKAE